MQKINEFIENSKKELDSRREDLEIEERKILDFLNKNFLMKKEINNVIVQGRVKGSSSLSEKIIRKRYADRYETNHVKFINELPDLIGIRLICLLLDEEEDVYKGIQTTFTESVGDNYFSIPELKGTPNNLVIKHIGQPEEQKNKKKIYRISCKWQVEELVIPVELQIKSLINMFWGEVEHMLFYKNYTYMIGTEFYSSMMDSIFKNLVSVDSQLKQMSQQLSRKNKEEQFQEIKQMFAKLMYNMFHEKFHVELIDIEIDLREIYDLMVQIEFKDVLTISRAQKSINNLISTVYDDKEFNSSLFVFEDYDSSNTILREERKDLGITLGQLSKSNDIYWVAFIGLYKLLKDKPSTTELVDSLVNDLMSFYSRFDSVFDAEDENTLGRPLFKKGIELGIVHAFTNYKKLDFFLIDRYQSKIFFALDDYLKTIKDSFISLSKEEIESIGEIEIISLVKVASSLKVMSVIEGEINITYLENLYKLLENKEISGLIFDMQKFSEIINSQNDVKAENLFDLFTVNKK